MPTLFFTDDAGDERALVINELFSEITIGRSTGNVIKVSWPSISRRHAKIVYADGVCTLYDLGSSNGTLVNGAHVFRQMPRTLRDGDSIKCGDVEFRYTATDFSRLGGLVNQSVAMAGHQQWGEQLCADDGYRPEWAIYGEQPGACWGRGGNRDGSRVGESEVAEGDQGGGRLGGNGRQPFPGESLSGVFGVQDCPVESGEPEGGQGSGREDGEHLSSGLGAAGGVVDDLMEQLVKMDSRLSQVEQSSGDAVSQLNRIMLDMGRSGEGGNGVGQVESILQERLSGFSTLEQVAQIDEKLTELAGELSFFSTAQVGTLLSKIERLESTLVVLMESVAGGGLGSDPACFMQEGDSEPTRVMGGLAIREDPIKSVPAHGEPPVYPHQDLERLEEENTRLREELRVKKTTLDEFEERIKGVFDHMARGLQDLSSSVE